MRLKLLSCLVFRHFRAERRQGSSGQGDGRSRRRFVPKRQSNNRVVCVLHTRQQVIASALWWQQSLVDVLTAGDFVPDDDDDEEEEPMSAMELLELEEQLELEERAADSDVAVVMYRCDKRRAV